VAEAAAWTAAEAAEAAEAAGRAAEAAGRVAEAAAWAAKAAVWAAGVEDAMIAALEGVLAIGRQAEPVEPARFAAAIKLFEEARSR
jgi:hypothetical protein